MTRYTSDLADITQQEYASSPEWAFDRMADPIASEVAQFKKGQVREENLIHVGNILRRHGVTPDT